MSYTLEDFVDAYGGSMEAPPQEWLSAKPAAAVSADTSAKPAAAIPADTAAPAVKQMGLGGGVANETRIDPADGVSYTLEDFVDAYGGSMEAPPQEWLSAKPTAAVPVDKQGDSDTREKRLDISDGESYSLQDFVEAYGGTLGT